MKVLETEYNGVLFRSRLEARWAIMFDALGLEWIYEPECFVLENKLKYTPDFYLKKYNLYVEIKPSLECLDDNYNIERWNFFNAKLLLLMGDYPNFNVNIYWSLNHKYPEISNLPVVFCPNSKYEPFYYSGGEVGEEDSFFKDEYKDELNKVKAYRFYK